MRKHWKRMKPTASLLLSILAACAAGHPWDQRPRPARDLPPTFVADPSMPPAPAAAAGVCPVRLIDPGSNTKLRLVRSASAADGGYQGDYEVDPPGRYGTGQADLLRVLCTTGRPAGIVRR